MSYTLLPIAVTVPAGATSGPMVPISIPGDLATVSWVKISNLSPFLLQLNNINGGTEWLEPSLVAAYPVPGLSTAIQATPFNEYGTAASSALSSVIAVTWYGYGEQPSGTYPVSLAGLTNLGNALVATQLVNDGSPLGTNIIESTPAGASSSYVLVRNDGTFDLQAISNNVLTDMLHLTPGTSSTPAKLVATLVQTTGAITLDSGHIYTDGVGNLTVGTTTANSTLAAGALNVYATGGGKGGLSIPEWTLGFTSDDALYQIGGFTGAGAYGAHRFIVVNNGSQETLFSIGATNNSAPLSWIDGAGILHAPAPVTLTTGNQETGRLGSELGNAAGGTHFGIGVNFKTIMTNTPTSLTLTANSSSNSTVGGASNIDINGFNCYFIASAAGDAWWYGSYTTVGNCLLAVDTTAQTLDHHCDPCGHVSTGAAFSALTVSKSPREALSYTCPSCGTVESFNTALTATDEADTTPQGSGAYATTRGAQATLIRQLLVALGLPTAP
jgi:hypothetical protein